MEKNKSVETNILELLPDTAFFQGKILLIPSKVHLSLSVAILDSAYRINLTTPACTLLSPA